MDWDKLRVFYIVADSGSFTKATSRLQISQSAISRQISALEDRMGVPLFHRHARGLVLTEQGAVLFRTTRAVFSELAMAEARLTENLPVSQQAIKISCTVGFGTCWLAPRLPLFLKNNPDLRVTLKLSDNPVDLTISESDVAISSSVSEDNKLCHQLFIERPLHIYSSRKYLLENGIPLTFKDLSRHRLLVFNELGKVPFEDINWILTSGTEPGVKHIPYLTINNLYAMGRALEAGCGIGCLPDYVAKKCKGLVQIFPETPPHTVRFHYIYPRELEASPRIQNLLQYLIKEAQKEETEGKGLT